MDRTDETAGRCFYSLYACLMCAFPSILPILPCGLYSDMYAAAYNLVLLIRVQTKALFHRLIKQVTERRWMLLNLILLSLLDILLSLPLSLGLLHFIHCTILYTVFTRHLS
jgi:hypothetical protein